MSQMLRNRYVKLYTVISHYIQNVPLEFGFGNRLTTASLQPVEAVRGKVDVKSRQSLGILRRSVSYGGQGIILKIPADLVATPPCAQRSEGASFSATRRAGATAGYIFYKN